MDVLKEYGPCECDLPCRERCPYYIGGGHEKSVQEVIVDCMAAGGSWKQKRRPGLSQASLLRRAQTHHAREAPSGGFPEPSRPRRGKSR